MSLRDQSIGDRVRFLTVLVCTFDVHIKLQSVSYFSVGDVTTTSRKDSPSSPSWENEP